ncbi:MAG: hypothetical protein JKY34_06010 [Kordiimonadaceae bacterium]|nr:hypothetical protein [Kordiimonadaceae bacterium]
MLKIAITLPIAIALILTLTIPSRAELTQKHVQVALKSLNFAKPKIPSGATVALIYSEGNAQSKALAENLSAFIASGKARKKIKLVPKIMPATAIDLTGARLVFVTDAAMAKMSEIVSAANSNNALTVASDIKCSASGLCALSIAIAPKVQIYLSSSAAEKAGVSFSNAFMMLVKKH